MIQLDPNLDKLTHTKRTDRLEDHHLDRNIADLLLETCSKLNIIRASNDPLPPVAPGIRNHIRFCKLARRPFFPFAEDAAELRPSTTNPGGGPLKRTRRAYKKHASCLTYQLAGCRRLSGLFRAAYLMRRPDHSNFLTSPDETTSYSSCDSARYEANFPN